MSRMSGYQSLRSRSNSRGVSLRHRCGQILPRTSVVCKPPYTRGLTQAVSTDIEAMAETKLVAPAEVGNGVALGRGHSPAPPSSDNEIEAAIAALMAKRTEWFEVDCKARAQLLRQCKQSTAAMAEEVASVLTNAKGAYGKGVSEEMGALTAVLLALDAMAAALDAGGQPKPAKMEQRTASDGTTRWIVDASPQGLDTVAFNGLTSEVWIKPGQEPTQGKLYRDKAAGAARVPSGIAAVLAAGNQANVIVFDAVNQLVLHDSVVAVKLNPTLDYLGPYLERMLEPLHSRGFVRFLYGGADVAQKLVHHADVARVCMTGSGATYDAIMWGPGKPKTGKPLLSKPMDAELGCVTPIIVVPSAVEWTPEELEFQAQKVLSTKVLNAGHNCLSTELIVTAANWPQRAQFMEAVRDVLGRTQERWPWYPNSEAKYAAFKERFPNAQPLGAGHTTSNGRSTQPWMLAEGLSPETAATQSENWCGVLQEVRLDTKDPAEDVAAFLQDAVRFCNDRCMGSLSMGIIVHPETQKAHPAALDDAVAQLRYGTIAVNCPTTYAFVLPGTPWGAWAAAGTPEDIGSGNAFSGNALMFDAVEKGVVRGPWVEPVKPAFFPTARGGVPVMRRVVAYARQKSFFNLVMIILTAIFAPWFDR